MLKEFSVLTVELYILLFFTYSFAGWFMESVGGILNVKKFVNRGFLIGPYCPVYGLGVVLITLLLAKYSDDIPVVFVLSTLICGTLEYFTSYIMEKLFNARWWDYNNRKFNINGRVCLETLIPFGIAGTLFLCVINPFFINIYVKIPDLIRHIITTALSIIFLVDFIISFIVIWNFKGEIYKQKDNTEEISNMVKDKTEDILMKAESDAIVFTRKLKVKSLKMQRKVRYTVKQYAGKKLTRKELYEELEKRKKVILEKIESNKENFNYNKKLLEYSLRKRKEELEKFQKDSKTRLENKIKTMQLSSEEFNKQVKEKFRSRSILSRRLMDAFPNMAVKAKPNKNRNK